MSYITLCTLCTLVTCYECSVCYSNAVRKLRAPCIKVESLSRRYRPLYAEFDVFPASTVSPGDGIPLPATAAARPEDCQRGTRKDTLAAR